MKLLLTKKEMDVVDEEVHKEGIYYKIQDEQKAFYYHHSKFNKAQLKKLYKILKEDTEGGAFGISEELWAALAKEINNANK